MPKTPKPPRTHGPAKGPGHGGPAKGPGFPRELWTPEKAREMAQKAVVARAQKREREKQARAEWHAANPEYGGVSLSPKQVREYIAGGIPPLIDKAFEMAHKDGDPNQFKALEMLVSQGIGKAPQEVTGKDGAPLAIISEERLLRELVAMGAELGLPVVIEGEGEEVE